MRCFRFLQPRMTFARPSGFSLSLRSCLQPVWSLLKGDYDQTGLPLVVLPWHAVANGIEALLWLGAATLIWKGSAREAGWVGLFAAGMFSWDALTTAFLPNMPIPWQAVWSPVVICVMLAATNGLRKV